MNVAPVWQHLRKAPAAALMAAVQAYRYLLSPWLGSHCRYTPTCSAYALEALQAHGAAVGTYLAARRILRCRPGCSGGHDPIPEAGTHLFSRFLTPSPAPTPQARPAAGAETSQPGPSVP